MRPPLSLLTVLATLVLTGTACGDEVAGDPSSSVPRPAKVPASAGEVTTSYPVTVLDDGHGAELCLGAVADSLPPQCGGPKLVGWDWAEHAGDYEEGGNVRWGEFVVTGTFDGTSVTATKVVPGDQVDPPRPIDGRDQFATPCPEPEGGWRVLDPATTTSASLDRTMRTAERMPGYATSWVDQSVNPAWHQMQDGTLPEREIERRLNDPTLTIIDVKVTGDPEAAERELRETWGGSLCVTRAERTQKELEDIAQDLLDLPGSLEAGPGNDVVDLEVVYDDGSYQAYADARYGEGTVRVTSALVDAAAT
jgi:hypothetical protein